MAFKKERNDVAVCGIALGGNIGDTSACFRAALNHMETAGHRVCRVSTFYRTPAMGESAGRDFLNAAAVIETSLPPAAILAQLHAVEQALGRTRTVHWGPRAIDLDLLFHDGEVVDTEDVVVPHPCLWYRRFVLEPLHEIAADWRHPVLQETVCRLFQRLQTRPLRFELPPEISDSVSLMDRLTELAVPFGKERLLLTDAGPTPRVADQAFARLVFRSTTSTEANRRQPQHNVNRHIELAADADAPSAEIIRSMHDVVSAALG